MNNPSSVCRRSFTFAAAIILGLAAQPGALRAQTIDGAQQLNALPDAGQYLGNAYKDEYAGFRISPPVFARVINKAGSLDLVNFVLDSKASGGMLQRVEVKLSLDDYARKTVEEMTKSFKAVQVLENRKLQFQNFPAARLSTSMQAELGSGLPPAFEQQLRGKTPAKAVNESIALFRQQLIVQTRENQFMVLTYYSPLINREEATQIFNAVAGSLEILDKQEMLKRRAEAVILGKKWIAEQNAEELRAKLNNQPTFFRMLTGGATGTDVGYIRFDEREMARDGFKGVEIEMNSRSFKDEVTMISGQNLAYWAYSRNEKGDKVPPYSYWDNKSVTDTKLPMRNDPTRLEARQFWLEESGTLNLESGVLTADQLKQLQAEREELIRKNPNKPPPPPIPDTTDQYRLVVNLTGDSAQRIPTPGINIPIPSNAGAMLPKILEYLWPRLVDVTKSSEMTFLVFDSSNKKIANRNLIVTGRKERIAINGRMVETWKLIDELDPNSTTLWVDDNGRVISMRTSDQTVMLPTTEQEMERRWALRLQQQKK